MNPCDYVNSRDFIRNLANKSEQIFVPKDRFVTFTKDTSIFVSIYDLCHMKDRSNWTEQEELNYNQAKDIYYVNSFPKNTDTLSVMNTRCFTEKEVEIEVENKTIIGANIVSAMIKYNIFLEELFYVDKLSFF